MNVTIFPSEHLSGEITAPPSKARTHRATIAGLLSNGTSIIQNPLKCDDTTATLHAIVALGAEVDRDATYWRIQGEGQPRTPTTEIFCGESAATLRFLAPIAALTGERVVLTGDDRLMRRPLAPLIAALREIGVPVEFQGKMLTVFGKPTGRVVHIEGDVSSQFITGLLFAGPLMQQGIKIVLTSPAESRDYLHLTLDIMKQHGIAVKADPGMTGLEIESPQSYSPATHKVPGDYSSAAYLLSAAAITDSNLVVRGLSTNDSEPDDVIIQILSRMGSVPSVHDDGILMENAELEGTRVNLRDNPDLGPIVSVLGCYAHGETKIEGAARLRHKESDRLKSITSELGTLGAKVEETDDGLTVQGPCTIRSGHVNSHGDHRIAMALAVAALGAKGEVTIHDAECVSKSYPSFFEDMRSLGVKMVE